ncbi:hypothetical protein SAMN04487770_101420 [Butyrivibrio sp. ob235]|uniref:hypothetical protein n=1 Tax=Butyrivibrio sp. ob235 TaxID=1761780 RepID=UPI0008CF8629|nr:hypothetical protein [Butyrivibrio sp. ob235]SEK44697.1 hypothetical protein SAMN04487770_101420 [Butyrivibrio sp. ob235]
MKTSKFSTALLFILTMAIIAGGLFFDAHETAELSDYYGNRVVTCADCVIYPLKPVNFFKANDSFIIDASEVRGVRAVSEVIKRLENSAASKRIVILSLILCILISEGAFYTSVLPSVFPWTNIICSRRTLIRYIHSQDGAK